MPSRHLQPHDGREAALAQLLLDHLEQVLGLLLVPLDVGVAGHPEGHAASTISMPGNRLVEVVRTIDVLERAR